MARVLEAVVSNGLLAAIGAVVLLAACRWTPLRNFPAARQALWMLLLVKLITPPLFSPGWLAVKNPLPAAGRGWPLRAGEGPLALPQPDRNAFVAAAEAPPIPFDNEEIGGPLTLDEHLASADDSEWVAANETLDSAAPAATEQARSWLLANGLSLVAAASLLVSATIALRLWRRTRKVRRLVAVASSAPAELAARLQSLASKMEMAVCPRLVVVEGRFSPFLWAAPLAPVIVLPKQIVGDLSQEQLDFVLAHELAHLRRGDRWTNLLSSAVATLFWFHPGAWLARREIRAAQEMCCDAMVVSLFADSPHARRSYADTLLASLDYVAGKNSLTAGKSLAPVLASEFGESLSLRRRFEMLANCRLTHRWSWPSALTVIFAAALLPAGLTFGQAPGGDVTEETKPADTKSADTKSAEKTPEAGHTIKLEPKIEKVPLLSDLPLVGELFLKEVEEPSADRAEPAAEKSEKWPAEAGALHALDTGKQYAITMQNGQEIIGEVAHQNDNWKVIKVSGSDETITINVNHIQYFRVAREGNEKPTKQIKGYALRKDGGPEMIKVVIGAKGETTVDGVAVTGDKMMVDAIAWAAKQRKGPTALDITIDAGAPYKTVEQLMELAARSGLKTARVSKAAPTEDKPQPKDSDDKGVAAGDFDNDGELDLYIAKARDAKKRAQIEHEEAMADEKKLLMERAAKLYKLKTLEPDKGAVDYEAIKDKFAAQAAMVDKLQQELARTQEQLKEAERIIAELKPKPDTIDTPQKQ